MPLEQKIVRVNPLAYNNFPTLESYLKDGWLVKTSNVVNTFNGQELHHVIERELPKMDFDIIPNDKFKKAIEDYILNGNTWDVNHRDPVISFRSDDNLPLIDDSVDKALLDKGLKPKNWDNINEVETYLTYGGQTAYVDKFGCIQIMITGWKGKSIRMDIKDLELLIETYKKLINIS